ncbi:fungal-specific transcription factor domain-containing protein [Corynascus novoguineensis]|uniref:Fungal-specific transcription factor domain-containing protein n=1 Tax=Corynascus novoguineensis TaxID=1126955 RepID=A0AAN7D1L1_9PEZI|nr:fungal-specific transcription factor domain-containing protein [Corynascus novoguineensis]
MAINLPGPGTEQYGAICTPSAGRPMSPVTSHQIRRERRRPMPATKGMTSRKRSLDSPDRGTLSEGDDASASDVDVSGALNGLGYLSHHHHLVLGQGNDCLVDNWLNGANHQYYALYPPEFRTQYDGWWATPRNKVTPELTSLILRVCACSLHFIIDDSVRVRLETELDTDVLTFANRLHTAAEKLSTSIPPGKGGLVHVQQLFLTAFWFKSAEKWTEAWHALSKAIRAANEIGLHQDSSSEGMSEYDREMRRRVWVILYLWDFALGSMLSRPFLVNHADCTVVMPTLTLEYNRDRPDQPSPFRHMNLHCQLCIDMAAQLGGSPKSEEDKAKAARRMQEAVENWFKKLPAEYALKNPETRWDREFDWVIFQRRYLHLIAYMGLFSQLRPFLTRSSATPMSELESSLRAAGVDAALGLMEVSWKLFENLVSVGAKFHYAIFCIFDAATVMCSAFVQDEARNLPQRETILEAIKKCLGMLAEVAPQSKTTAALYRILRGLLTKLPLSAREQNVIGLTKRMKGERVSPPSGRTPASRSPSSPSAQRPRPEVRQDSEPRHRGTSASSESESTLDSSNFQPRSESSVSLPRSDRSIDSQISSSEAQARRRPTVPSNGVPPADHHPESNGFAPPTSIHSAYPVTRDFMPPTSVMPTTVYVPPGEYPAAPAYVQGDGFSYNPVSPAPYSQPGWQPAQLAIGMNNPVQMYQEGGLTGFNGAIPEVLQYWEWENLNLGHPVSWNQLQSQSGIRQHNPALPEGFNGQGLANDCGASSSTEDMSRRRK